MRIADLVLAQKVKIPTTLTDVEHQKIARGLTEATSFFLQSRIPVIEASLVAEQVFTSPLMELEDFPCLAPPWEVFWLEYSRPHNAPPAAPERWGLICVEHGIGEFAKLAQERSWPVEAERSFSMELYAEFRSQVYGPCAMWEISIDDRGIGLKVDWTILSQHLRPSELDPGVEQAFQKLMWSALQTITFLHCFGGDTEVVTRAGVLPISKLAGTEVELLTKDMKLSSDRSCTHWVRARVEGFGQQPTFDLRVRRDGHEQVIRTTIGHRWFVGASARRNTAREVTTVELRPGDRLVTVRPPAAGANCKESAVGVAHGLVYGDGSRNAHESWAEFFGDDREEMLRFFPSPRVTRLPNRSTGAIRVSGLPRSFKELPREDEGTAYLFSFLAGWFAADGHVGKQGQVVLTSANADALHWMRRVGLSRLGMVMGEPQVVMRRGIDGKVSPLWSMLIDRGSVSARFFVREYHRVRFESMSVKANPNRWEVVSVEPSGLIEEVFCAVVPDTEAFVIGGMILTGNCRNVHVVDGPRPERKVAAKQTKKLGRPPLTYSVVKIDPFKGRRASSGGTAGGTGRSVRMHTVPGHFAHFGNCCPGSHEARGLAFGKLTGMFWVPQHVRGSLSEGAVVHDYVITP